MIHDNCLKEHQISIQDNEFLQLFLATELREEEFNHRAHLKIGYCLICQYDVDMACTKIKSGILNFLEHIGQGKEKYHETITKAWILAIHHFMRTSRPSISFQQFIEQNPILLDQGIMYTHYSHHLLQSELAKSKYLEPDLETIPIHC